MSNVNLTNAKRQKIDEFYTQYEDIEKELVFYEDQLKGKKIYCNCDDVGSEFVNYFLNNYKTLELAGLVVTGYNKSGEDTTIVRYYTDADTRELFQVDGFNGDFRHEESIKILEWCDIVVTNPPFSLFREYVAQLIKYNKKFLIIGNLNAISYKEIFPLFKDNKLWMGATCFNGGATFFFGDASLYDPAKISNPKFAYLKDDKFYWRVNGVRWFTNIEHTKRHELIPLTKLYNEEEYPHYDNYNAIEVNKVYNIPLNYNGIIGVPISFLDKYNPDQFEIIGGPNMDIVPEGWQGMTKEFLDLYYEQGGKATLKPGNRNAVYVKDGKAVIPYARILIRNKHPQEV